MKRNMDLVRAILLGMESYGRGSEVVRAIEQDGKWNEATIKFHCHIMHEANLINATSVSIKSLPHPIAIPNYITWDGYEFLELAKNDTTWNRAKEAAANGTMKVLKTALTILATETTKAAVMSLRS